MSEPGEYGVVRYRRSVLWIEILSVFAVMELPIIASYMAFGLSGYPSLPDNLRTADDLQQAAGYVGLIGILLFVIWMSGDLWEEFGLGRPKWLGTLGLGALYLVLGYFIFPLLATAFPPPPAADPQAIEDAFIAPSGVGPTIAFLLTTIVAAAYEEIFYRGYLLTRLTELLHSQVAAIALSTLLFGVGHLYQGWLGVASACGSGLLACIFMLIWRNIYALILGHCAYNILISYENLRFLG